jgi:hypothetical protein
MFNGMTKIVVAGALSLGTATMANAAGFNHARYENGVQVASLGGAFCTDRPWTCSSREDSAATSSHAIRAGHPRITERHHGPSASDLISTLQSKVTEIISACGSKLISGYRPGARVAGSGHPSLHSVYPARAADMAGNPSCIYSHLQGWAGGYSTDYGHVHHVHLSYSPPGTGYLAGREWHARFVHYTGGYHRRYSGRHHRYAMR